MTHHNSIDEMNTKNNHAVCLILSDKNNNLIDYQAPDGKSLKKGIEFMYRSVANKDDWTGGQDVMYWDNWPIAQPFLVFGACKFGVKDWFKTWDSLDHFPSVDEVIRNLPVRNPVIWMN